MALALHFRQPIGAPPPPGLCCRELIQMHSGGECVFACFADVCLSSLWCGRRGGRDCRGLRFSPALFCGPGCPRTRGREIAILNQGQAEQRDLSGCSPCVPSSRLRGGKGPRATTSRRSGLGPGPSDSHCVYRESSLQQLHRVS